MHFYKIHILYYQNFCYNKNMKLEYIVKDEDNYIQILKNYFHMSKRLIKKVEYSYVYINGKSIQEYYIENNDFIKSKAKIDKHFYHAIKSGDKIEIDLGFDEEDSEVVPNEKIKLEILYEDEWMLIVNKPPFINVHPSPNDYDGSLANGVKAYFNKIGLRKKIRIVNRLDKNTSGIVIFAKCEYIQEMFTREMKNNEYQKKYIAIVEGKLEGFGTIDKPIARKLPSIIEREVNPSGEKAVTHYKVLKNFKIDESNFSEVELLLETGRTHQIRVHLAYIGHPIVGDTLYGNASKYIDRQALHAYAIDFTHPITNEHIHIETPLPKDIKNLI